MTLKQRIKWIALHLRREEGSVSAEAVLMTPLLVWAWIAMYVFFEGLRENNINLKASYTVADLLSREEDEVDMDYLNGMTSVFEWLSRSSGAVALRVTVVEFDDNGTPGDSADDFHDKVWSRGVSGPAELTQEQISERLTPHIPILAHDDTAIVIETWAQFQPILDMVFARTDVHNIIVTPPRFAGQLKFEGINDGTGDNHEDGSETEEIDSTNGN